MSRDWNEIKDRLKRFLELEEKLKGAGPSWAEEIVKMQSGIEEYYYVDVSDLLEALAAEKERADKAVAELSQIKSDYKYIVSVKDSHKKRLEEWGNRALESEAREQKLREAIESAMELGMFEYATYAYEHFEETLSTLYPKEEEAK